MTTPTSTTPTSTSSIIKQIKQVKCYGGLVKQYAHDSVVTKCKMQFCIFLPPGATTSSSSSSTSTVGGGDPFENESKIPVVYYLAGLTCNEELMLIKSGAQRIAAARGLAIVCPDTSPRQVDLEGAEDSWDFGSGAGFYVDATESPWSAHYRMASYVTKELPMVSVVSLGSSLSCVV